MLNYSEGRVHEGLGVTEGDPVAGSIWERLKKCSIRN